ncbi:response regulator [Myxococcus sp. K38C18041901]|uniref:response regulator n=1 Tax=Myxococcus guangdongensis TaxID=2906760 RepID=UPI0020A72288|nr:response regulator [Myxococcus guangdongensis]MCP3063143.1 response regulator [Myxococcus guangdongensis]
MTGPLLVVDDDADLREALEEVLRDAGYSVTGAINGKHALDVLGDMSALPALVLLDMMMPVLDGAGFARAMRQVPAWRDIPVLVFSASANARQVAEEIGACGHLRKPVDVDTLLDAVRRHQAA